jgi:hypothetical protein
MINNGLGYPIDAHSSGSSADGDTGCAASEFEV